MCVGGLLERDCVCVHACCLPACVHACMCACLRASVPSCLCACVRACVRACPCVKAKVCESVFVIRQVNSRKVLLEHASRHAFSRVCVGASQCVCVHVFLCGWWL